MLFRSSKVAIKRIGAVGIFILLFTFGLREIAPGPTSAPDYPSNQSGPEIIIEIPSGATGSQIGEILFANDVVKSSLSYFRVAVANPESNRIAPGEHRLETKIPAKVALGQLLDPDRIVNLVRVREGSRVQEVRDELLKFGYTRSEISEAIRNLSLPREFQRNENDSNRAEIGRAHV